MKLENYCGGCGHQYTFGQNYCPECGLRRGIEEPEKPKVHPLDEMIDDISKASGGIGRVTSLSKKLRYESIKWAWETHDGYIRNTPLKTAMLRECKPEWIIDQVVGTEKY